MKLKVVIFSAVIFFISVVSTYGASGIKKEKSSSRAKRDQTVWVLLNHVKADKRQQFEKLFNDIFSTAEQKLNGLDLQAFNQTRFLYPTEMEKDSTYTYVFIMDPVVKDADYSIHKVIEKIYGEEKAQEYYDMFLDCLDSNQTAYILTQSAFN